MVAGSVIATPMISLYVRPSEFAILAEFLLSPFHSALESAKCYNIMASGQHIYAAIQHSARGSHGILARELARNH